MNYGIPATRVVAYTYEADYHCTEDAESEFGTDEHGFIPEDAEDSEGNPVHAVFTSDLDTRTVEACSDCGQLICLCCGIRSTREDRPTGTECWNCHTAWEVENE